jgi:hypothetical protein
MQNGTIYLNKTGHRWMRYENGRKPTFFVRDEQGNYHQRTIIFLEAFGQHTVFYFCWKGFKVSAFPEWCEEHQDKAVVKEESISWPKCRLKDQLAKAA